MSRRCVLALLPLLAGCAAYDPPMAGDHKAVRYQADLMRCRKQASSAAAKVANATPSSAVRAIFASDAPEHQQVQACMQSRGYGPAP